MGNFAIHENTMDSLRKKQKKSFLSWQKNKVLVIKKRTINSEIGCLVDRDIGENQYL